MQACVLCAWEWKKKEWNITWLCVRDNTPAVDKHLLCLAWCLLYPPLSTIDISFYANAAFGYVRTRQYFHRQSFIPACLWPYGPRQNYCCTVHKLLSLCQELLLHKQTADTHSTMMWGSPEAKATEGMRYMRSWIQFVSMLVLLFAFWENRNGICEK